MRKTGRVCALAALSGVLAACGGGSGKQAAGEVQAFLAAVQDHDRAAFEARVDRPAVRHDLRAQVAELGRAAGLEVEGGPSEFALDRMINPDAIRIVGPDGGPMAAPPSVEQVRAMLRKVDGRHVCIHDTTQEKSCVLTFEKQKGVKGKAAGWRLVRMPAADLVVQAPAAVQKG